MGTTPRLEEAQYAARIVGPHNISCIVGIFHKDLAIQMTDNSTSGLIPTYLSLIVWRPDINATDIIAFFDGFANNATRITTMNTSSIAAFFNDRNPTNRAYHATRSFSSFYIRTIGRVLNTCPSTIVYIANHSPRSTTATRSKESWSPTIFDRREPPRHETIHFTNHSTCIL